jgi:RHS repeat-associated protein
VVPGDKVKVEVYAKYFEASNSDLASFVTWVASMVSGVDVPSSMVDGAGYTANAGATLPFGSPLDKTNESGTVPKAYVNWVVFNQNYQPDLLKSGFRRVTSAALQSTGSDGLHELLESPEITISEPGYVYVWLSNENETPIEVYFDDFKVAHTKSQIIQADDYYPFGLAFNSYSRENSTKNNYLYNGIERQDELDLGWDLAQFRAYEPTLCRFMQIDPVIKEHESPYAWNTNNPILFADPSGADSTQRANAVAKAEEYAKKNPGDSYPTAKEKEEGKFKGAPGEKVDCSGLVSQAIIAGGESDPVLEGSGGGVERIAKNLPKVGDKTDMSKVEVGTVVALNNTREGELDPKKDFKHTGIISEVVRNDDGSIKSMKMIDSGGTPGSKNGSGPRVSTLISNGKSQYWGDRINGFYKWDTKPDKK